MLRWVFLAMAAALLACGGKGANSASDKSNTLDGDPLVLLPGSAVFAGRIDARSLFQQGGVAAQWAALADRFVPLGDDVGFQASRDVDTVVFAAYASTGADVALVVRGRFDEAKFAAATTGKGGVPIVRGVYAGRATSTVGAVSFAVLTSKTLVAGTGDGLRRVLERIQAGTFEPALPPWVAETLVTKDAIVAVTADFATQPMVSAAIGSLKLLSWLQGLRTARIIANFANPGMNVAATLGYGVPEQAESAVQGVRFVDGWLKVLGPLLGGIRLQNLVVETDRSDLRCKFALDDSSLASLLALLPRLVPSSSLPAVSPSSSVPSARPPPSP